MIKEVGQPFHGTLQPAERLQEHGKNLPCTVMYSHIKGHQDNGHPTVLSKLAWLNIEADLAAKACIDVLYKGKSEYQLPNESWHLEIAGR